MPHLGVCVGRAFGPWAGLAAAMAAPLCGYVTVRMAERVKRIGGLVEGYRTVKGRRAVLDTVFAHRTSVVGGRRGFGWRREPDRLRYGTAHAQVAEIWRPPQASGDLPSWPSSTAGSGGQLYTKRLMHRMAAAVVAHGWAAYNIEYRRVGRFGGGGWPATFDDVHAAVDALAEVGRHRSSRASSRVGIPPGGTWPCGRGRRRTDVATGRTPVVPVRAAISLAGVVDLVAAARLGLGGGAVPSLMGGEPEECPTRYALGSPAALLPLGLPQFLSTARPTPRCRRP